MVIKPTLRPAVLIVLTLVALTGLQAPAAAHLFWDLGGGEERDASNRELVRFSPQFAPGEIIVSFGDRWLY